ncbi:metal-dependent hydrolase [Dethiothermospora halolimnae]|uniref:metal-dependent hydrolase n=1 Tax=Dethiothermospora halolimnae TaxID=3114390 RepID=UPI003CCBD110
MQGKTHMIIGAAASVTTALKYPIESGIILITASVIGALLPDLDHPNSKINQSILFFNNKKFMMYLFFTVGLGLIVYDLRVDNNIYSLLGVSLIITSLSGHRSFTHSIVGIGLFSTVAYLFSEKYGIPEIWIGFTLGYISHLVADFFTVAGIQLFFPVEKRVKFPINIKTGSMAENVLLLMLTVYIGYVMFKFPII